MARAFGAWAFVAPLVVAATPVAAEIALDMPDDGYGGRLLILGLATALVALWVTWHVTR